MEKITAHIRPINWTEGDVYGMTFVLSGVNPSVRISWGDGKSNVYYGNEIEANHIYPKDVSLLFVVEAYIDAERIEHVYPTGGDCDYELIDFSEAPSIYEIVAQRTQKVIIDNPNLEYLDLTINLGDEYDLTKCPNLKWLNFTAETHGIKSLDLSHCHKLRTFSYMGYCAQNLRKITFANDAPLCEVDISGHNFLPSCIEALHRIVDRNNGFIIGEFEPEPGEDDFYIPEHTIEPRNMPIWKMTTK